MPLTRAYKQNLMDDKRWHLLMTKPRQEKVAKLNLTQQAYGVFLPHHQVRKRQKTGYTVVREPLFPRYIFIQLSQTQSNWAPIRSTRGVANIVRFGLDVGVVPNELIAALKLSEEAHFAHITAKDAAPSFKQGERVRILEGVMAGYEGIFASSSNEERVHILLDIANKHTKLTLPVNYIAKEDDC